MSLVGFEWSSRRKLAAGLLLAALLGSFTVHAFCQSAPDPVKQKLQDEKDRADLQKAIADDQKAIAQDQADRLKAQFSIATDKLPQGNATLNDKVNIEATILAYRSAQQTAEKVAAALAQKACPSGVLFFDSKQMNDIWAETVLIEQLKLAKQQGGNLKLGPDSANLFPIAAAVDATLTLLSLFKSDTTIQGVQITPDDSALQMAVASGLRGRCPDAAIIDPSHYIAALVLPKDGETLLENLSALTDLRNAVNQQVIKAQADGKVAQKAADDAKAKLEANAKAELELEARIQDLNKKLQNPKNPADEKDLKKKLAAAQAELARNSAEKQTLQSTLTAQTAQVDKLTAYAIRATAFTAAVDALTGTLGKIDDSGLSLLNRMLRAESLNSKISDTTKFLSVHFVAVGGNNITKKGAFSTSIAFSGGAVVDYQITDNHGSIINSGLIPVYGKRVSEDDLNKVLQAQ